MIVSHFLKNGIRMDLAKLYLVIFRYTIDEIVDMMVMNEDGKMEFPKDLMMQDCLENQVEPLFGFVTNVTLRTDQPCLLDIECTEDGTTIDSDDAMLSDVDDLLLNIDKQEDFNTTTTPKPKDAEISDILNHDMTHRIANIEMSKIDGIKLQMFKPTDGVMEASNTTSKLVRIPFLSTNSHHKSILSANKTMASHNEARYLINARMSFSDPDLSSHIKYAFGDDYLTTYKRKGRYHIKSVVPSLDWNQPYISIAQDRSDINLTGK